MGVREVQSGREWAAGLGGEKGLIRKNFGWEAGEGSFEQGSAGMACGAMSWEAGIELAGFADERGEWNSC